MGDQNFPGHRALRNATDGRAAVCAGVAAGVGSALAQVLLWLAFTDAFPHALFRDTRLTAAILLGQGVLPPPTTFDAVIMLISALIHFALSILYGMHHSRQVVVRTAGHRGLIGIPDFLPGPISMLEGVLYVEQPHTQRTGDPRNGPRQSRLRPA